jgi:hypothetical protein
VVPSAEWPRHDRYRAPLPRARGGARAGNAFGLSQHARGFLRFNVAQSTDTRLFAVIDEALTLTCVADR